MQQQTAPLPLHRGEHRAVHALHPEEVHVQLPLCLREGDGLGQIHDAGACVVEQHIDAPGLREYFRDSLLNGSILGDVQLEHLQIQGFSLRKLFQFAR